MPKPYKGETKGMVDVSPSELLSNHIAIIALVGVVAMEWSRIEENLAYLFALLVFGDRQDKRDIGEAIAVHTFELAASFPTKRRMLSNAVDARIGGVTATKFDKLLDRLENVQKSRHNVVHGRWALSPDKKHLIRRSGRRLFKELEVYEVQDFQDIITELRAADFELATFYAKEVAPHLKPAVGLLAEEFVKLLMAGAKPADNP